MKNFKTHLIFCLALTLMVFSACNKEQNFINENPTEFELQQPLQHAHEITADIQIKNGILVFKNLNDYRSTLLSLNRMTTSEQLNWEKSINFQSMQQLFNEILFAEEQQKTHSAKYLDALRSKFIVENDLGYDLNIFNPAYASVLNKNGVVKVGNDIYQFTADALKVWENGNSENLQPLFQTDVTNQAIKVIPMNYALKPIDQFTDPAEEFVWEDQCQSEVGKERITLAGYFYSDYEDLNTLNIIFIKYVINIKSQIKDSQGNWNYDNEVIYHMEGNSFTMLELTDGNSVFQKDLEYNYFEEGTGGNFWFICDESGQYNAAPNIYTQPASLMSTTWDVKNEMASGTNLQCQISK